MADELVFYTNPMSRGRIVRWMLEEVGQPYRTEILEFNTTMKAPEYLALNPMGKVPAIRHGDVVVTEAGAICAYLADAFPDAGLAPPLGDKARGTYFRWLFFTAGPLDGAVVNQALGVQVPADKRPMVGYGSYEDAMRGLAFAVGEGPYVLGERFSAADVYLGSTLGWGMMTKQIEARPEFQAYLGRLLSRPASVRARQIDDALLPKPMAVDV
jgi:glutathione S-transferase